MKTWHKRDWQQFYEIARRPWKRHRPPRPVYPTGLNRVLPAQGFSLSELDDAGVDLDLACRYQAPAYPASAPSHCIPASRSVKSKDSERPCGLSFQHRVQFVCAAQLRSGGAGAGGASSAGMVAGEVFWRGAVSGI